MRRALFGLVTASLIIGAPLKVMAEDLGWNSQILSQDSSWYASPQARQIASHVLLHQSAEGGWPKNTALDRLPQAEPNASLTNSFDNQATTLPLAYLARVISASEDKASLAPLISAFDRGLDYVLAAQQPNGGWPQYFPLRGGYHDHITYNDEAMVLILSLLRDLSKGQPPYGFVSLEQRSRAAQALERGIQTILDTQVRHQGRLTAWCAQHDAQTLDPAWGRSFEPPSLSGSESVSIVRFLMSLDTPSPAVIAAIQGARDWFKDTALHGLRLETYTNSEGKADRRLVPSPNAPLLWARFYDLETHRPVYMGRDSIPHDDLAKIDHERRMGYTYVGSWARSLMDE